MIFDHDYDDFFQHSHFGHFRQLSLLNNNKTNKYHESSSNKLNFLIGINDCLNIVKNYPSIQNLNICNLILFDLITGFID